VGKRKQGLQAAPSILAFTRIGGYIPTTPHQTMAHDATGHLWMWPIGAPRNRPAARRPSPRPLACGWATRFARRRFARPGPSPRPRRAAVRPCKMHDGPSRRSPADWRRNRRRDAVQGRCLHSPLNPAHGARSDDYARAIGAGGTRLRPLPRCTTGRSLVRAQAAARKGLSLCAEDAWRPVPAPVARRRDRMGDAIGDGRCLARWGTRTAKKKTVLRDQGKTTPLS